MATEQVFQLLKAFEQFADRFSPAPSKLGQSKVVQYIRIQLILNEFFKGISLQDTHLSSAVPAEVFSREPQMPIDTQVQESYICDSISRIK